MRRSLRLLLAAACAPALAACNLSATEDAGTEFDVRSGSLGLLSVERFVDVDSQSLPRLVAGAKVARYRGLQGDALLGLLGALPRELETCRVEAGLNSLALEPEAHVELLSVGDISVRLGESVTTLSPRLFPPLASTAAGLFYAGDAEIVAPRAENDEYVLSAPGEAGMGSFEMVAGAPSELSGLSAEGLRIEGRLAITREHAVTLTWEPEDPRDRIEIELYAGGSVLSCAGRDDGHFVVSSEALAAIDADDDASMVVRRVRVLPLDISGIDSAYARIATTTTHVAQVK
jgi:hypothetical protein